MSETFIADGLPKLKWSGIRHDLLLYRCAQASEEEARAMSLAAALMAAGECTEAEWADARAALDAVEARLCAAWEAQHGAPVRNRWGQIIGGEHPALAPTLYDEALRNRARGAKP